MTKRRSIEQVAGEMITEAVATISKAKTALEAGTAVVCPNCDYLTVTDTSDQHVWYCHRCRLEFEVGT